MIAALGPNKTAINSTAKAEAGNGANQVANHDQERHWLSRFDITSTTKKMMARVRPSLSAPNNAEKLAMINRHWLIAVRLISSMAGVVASKRRNWRRFIQRKSSMP